MVTKCEQARDEVKVSRLLIKDYQASVLSYENALGKAEESGNLSAQEIDLLKVEVGQVREALANERIALALKEKEAKEYETALAKMTKSRNFYKTLTRALVVVTTISVAIAASVILKE